jgi:hypothetical protein
LTTPINEEKSTGYFEIRPLFQDFPCVNLRYLHKVLFLPAFNLDFIRQIIKCQIIIHLKFYKWPKYSNQDNTSPKTKLAESDRIPYFPQSLNLSLIHLTLTYNLGKAAFSGGP